MSQERAETIINTGMTGGTPLPSAADLKAERAQLKAKLVQVLERGMVHDRLHVELPPDVYGEWCRKDDLEIQRLQTLGFTVDTQYATKRSLHDGGDNTSQVADVIFMTCPRAVKEVIDEIRDEQFRRLNAPQTQNKEDRELIANTMRDSENVIPAFSDSTTHLVDRDEIREAVMAVDRQTS